MSINDHDSDDRASSIAPDSTDPLSPGRTDLDPSDEPGIDELPENEGHIPGSEVEDPNEEGVPDIDTDNAELDDAPNPR